MRAGARQDARARLLNDAIERVRSAPARSAWRASETAHERNGAREQNVTVLLETRTARNRPGERRAGTPAGALPAARPT